ncbi:hypothetical protein DICPUDRAFT_81655 [Dictyostelium purpureum]|uniref:ComC supersandwich domain-containing protein n=1 Tax=Dictyostelium purpureum TaxID=5786 RepID=F0ZU63_DICPU|nr:uncharacterized protein DICPUDRAFT_81655 [Dictyostelium purpureum]EGC32514.1 hypothetical protein DICPUDRAFT_81655 [Dictyostelium purpureum]|eukprot:XP_003290964.1 hypothetical protein DICPUDRAFT_81655 [Dictyostelium purpureum]
MNSLQERLNIVKYAITISNILVLRILKPDKRIIKSKQQSEQVILVQKKSISHKIQSHGVVTYIHIIPQKKNVHLKINNNNNNNQVETETETNNNGTIFTNKQESVTTFNQIRINEDNTNAIIKLIIEKVNDKDKGFTFAGNQFKVTKGGLKLSLSISNWLFKSNLNISQVQMTSDIQIDSSNKSRRGSVKDLKFDLVGDSAFFPKII